MCHLQDGDLSPALIMTCSSRLQTTQGLRQNWIVGDFAYQSPDSGIKHLAAVALQLLKTTRTDKMLTEDEIPVL